MSTTTTSLQTVSTKALDGLLAQYPITYEEYGAGMRITHTANEAGRAHATHGRPEIVCCSGTYRSAVKRTLFTKLSYDDAGAVATLLGALNATIRRVALKKPVPKHIRSNLSIPRDSIRGPRDFRCAGRARKLVEMILAKSPQWQALMPFLATKCIGKKVGLDAARVIAGMLGLTEVHEILSVANGDSELKALELIKLEEQLRCPEVTTHPKYSQMMYIVERVRQGRTTCPFDVSRAVYWFKGVGVAFLEHPSEDVLDYGSYYSDDEDLEV